MSIKLSRWKKDRVGSECERLWASTPIQMPTNQLQTRRTSAWEQLTERGDRGRLTRIERIALKGTRNWLGNFPINSLRYLPGPILIRIGSLAIMPKAILSLKMWYKGHHRINNELKMANRHLWRTQPLTRKHSNCIKIESSYPGTRCSSATFTVLSRRSSSPKNAFVSIFALLSIH